MMQSNAQLQKILGDHPKSLEALAKKIGISPITLRKYIAGEGSEKSTMMIRSYLTEIKKSIDEALLGN